MGYIKHNAVIVTSWDAVKVTEAYKKAVELLGVNSQIVSNIVQGTMNGQLSFFIAPDGSKEGWTTSNECDESRKVFQDWILKADNSCDYLEVCFGGDDEYEYIVRSRDKDLSALEQEHPLVFTQAPKNNEINLQYLDKDYKPVRMSFNTICETREQFELFSKFLLEFQRIGGKVISFMIAWHLNTNVL